MPKPLFEIPQNSILCCFLSNIIFNCIIHIHRSSDKHNMLDVVNIVKFGITGSGKVGVFYLKRVFISKFL